MTLLQWLRFRRACRRLERHLAERRNSFEIIDYRKRRAAALKGTANA